MTLMMKRFITLVTVGLVVATAITQWQRVKHILYKTAFFLETLYVRFLTDHVMVDMPEPEEEITGTPRAPDNWVTVGPPWGSAPHDTDHKVGESFDNFPDVAFAVSKMLQKGGQVQWNIYYNTAKINHWNPGPNDWRRIKAHERAHCRGWGHGDGNPTINAAYNPKVLITGT
jgi:hypothetical protein